MDWTPSKPRKIPLRNGGFALVDEADYEELSKIKWRARKESHTTYVFGWVKSMKRFMFMHRYIMKPPRDMEIDHLDRNGLNNTRGNMRICTRIENLARRVQKPKTSKYYGVCHIKGTSKYSAIFKGQYLGLFSSEKDAALAWNHVSKEMHGVHAVQNIL